ncbi:MAG: glycosyltransferase [Syntrophotaleaceae bacterium]
MLVSILINNHNYGKFIEESINSACNQSYYNIEIVVVDDGSNDNSVETISRLAKKDNRIKTYFKENGGQLSSFNRGFELAGGDIICFLDSDDAYKLNYIQKLVDLYSERKECDFIYCGLQEFGQSQKQIIQPFTDKITDLGYTAFLTYLSHSWIGERTSAISIRRSLANKIFPIPMEEDWRIRADDCVIWLASIVGGRKFYLAESLVNYRVHQSNHFFGKKEDFEAKYKRSFQVARFFGWVDENYPQFRQVRREKIFQLLLLEALTGKKNAPLLRHYARRMGKYKKYFSLKHRWYIHNLRKNPVAFLNSCQPKDSR